MQMALETIKQCFCFLSLVGLPEPPCFYETHDLENAVVTGDKVHKIISVLDYDDCKSECLGDRQCTMGTYQIRTGFNLCLLYTRESGVLMFAAVGRSFIKRCDGMFLFNPLRTNGRSILIIWMSPLSFLGASGVIFYFYFIFH